MLLTRLLWLSLLALFIGIVISSCTSFIDKNQSANIIDIQIDGSKQIYIRKNNSLEKYQKPIRNKSLDNIHLNASKKNISKVKNKYWISPVNNQAKIIHKYSTNQPRLSYQDNLGSEVYAVRSGTVEFSGFVEKLGNLLIIKHAHNYFSVYLNNYRNLVKTNQKVKKGQLIAQMGANPDDSNFGLLNFELRKGNQNINPLRFF